jgi:hypothetical protein
LAIDLPSGSKVDLGVSVQLVAYLNGERVDATQMTHCTWRALRDDPDYERLLLIECGLRASRVTLGDKQFFRHYRVTECTIEHKSESDQHLVMKHALKERIDATPGWRAEVEHAHPERAWIADVMAIHASGRRLAFEVQLSPQSEEEYIRRSQRYVDDGVGPVWIVPEDHDDFRVLLPMIVTGFGKSSDLPQVAGALMDLTYYQPLFGKRGRIGAAVDAVLTSAFHWPHGTPRQQLDEFAKLEQMKAKAAAEKQARAVEATELRRLAEENASHAAAELEARFIASAAAPAVNGSRPVLAAKRIWASEVRCMQAGHPMIIWRLTKPTTDRTPADIMWRPTSENFDNVRTHLDAWLVAAGNSVAKAKVYHVKGKPLRRTFVCPECQQIIQGRWVSALPPAKWTVVAEESVVARAEARKVVDRKPPYQPTDSPEMPRQPRLPVQVEESDWRFIGPRRQQVWMIETGTDELPYRLAAKKAHAERMEQLRANPRYRVSPNGFRFECTDCGGTFEDDNEGIHADLGCHNPGARGYGWR